MLPGEFFIYLLMSVPGITRFQVVQRQLNELHLSIVRGPEFNDASLVYIRQEITKALGNSVELLCHFVDEIALTPSGKLRVTICDLPPSESA